MLIISFQLDKFKKLVFKYLIFFNYLKKGIHIPTYTYNWIIANFFVSCSIFRFTGSNCQTRINECDSTPCANGATCIDKLMDYSCHCPYGFTGKHCEAYVDWCANNPCMNDATCKQVQNSFQCNCAPGWTGKLCDVEMVSCSDAALRKGKLSYEFSKTMKFLEHS